MEIAVIGVGGVGGYFGGKLTQIKEDFPEKIRTTFVARGRHLEEIQKNGLLLDTEEGELICRPDLAVESISEIPDPDLCLICVKGYDLVGILNELKPKISEKTMILPLLNGVDIYRRIRKVIDKGTVFPSCVYVGTHIERPGKVKQRGGACKILFGNDPRTEKSLDGSIVYAPLFQLLTAAGISFEWLDDPYPAIWSKFIFIASFGTVTANFKKTIGEVLDSPEMSSYVRDMINEIIDLAKAKGVSLPTDTAEISFNKGQSFPPETKTSFQRDFEQSDKKDERDLFAGAILRMGEEEGVSVEISASLYRSLCRQKPQAG